MCNNMFVGDDLGNVEVFGAQALSTIWTLPDGGKARFLGISSTECCLLCLGRNILRAFRSGCLIEPPAKPDTLEKLHVYDLNSLSDSPPISTMPVPKGIKYVFYTRFARRVLTGSAAF